MFRAKDLLNFSVSFLGNRQFLLKTLSQRVVKKQQERKATVPVHPKQKGRSPLRKESVLLPLLACFSCAGANRLKMGTLQLESTAQFLANRVF